MSSNKRKNLDHYGRRAKTEGYAARSVYKLQEIQQRFTLLSPGMHVLDMGAAPGSWTQYASGLVGPAGRVVAVDLSPMSSHAENIICIHGDFYSAEVLGAVAGYAPYNAILSDAAPATSGNRGLDTSRSAAIAEHVLYLCEDLLKAGGNVTIKVFQGGEEQELLRRLRAMFKTGRLFKPKACRSESFESYLLGIEYLGKR